jgi:mannose-6-phosphate isomerase
LRGATLHELWRERRAEIFGSVPDGPDRTGSSRFPLLIKLLDAQENLSLQVHPPRAIAGKLGGESKTEFWYIANAAPHARLYAGVKKGTTRKSFLQALENGTVEEHVHAIEAATGDAIFLPSGRMHALGGGNVLVEIQENSDTTYRIYDWGREKTGSPPREMHIAEAMECVDFKDIEPGLSLPRGETLAQNEFFEVQKWSLSAPRELAPRGQFAISCCLTGKMRCGDVDLNPGGFFLIPASSADRELQAVEEGTTLLRITIPG